MTVSKNTSLSFLFTLLSLLLFSQDRIDKPEEVKSWKLLNHSKAYMRVNDFYAAYPLLQELMARKPEDSKIIKMFAKCSRETRNYKEALVLYEQLYKLDPYGDADATYYYALMLKRIGKFEAAQEYFELFKKNFPNDGGSYKEYYATINNEIDGCKLASDLGKSDSIQVVHLDTNINKPHIDCAPIPLGDTLFYASLKTNRMFFEEDFTPKRQFYLAKKISDTVYSNIDISPIFPFNDSLVDVSNGYFTADKKTFYFSKCKKLDVTVCQIYQSKLIDNKWTNPSKLPDPINIEGFSSSYPAIGKDKKGNELLYFSSNRPNGLGGMDIWFSEKDAKGNYKKPINCGKIINSKQNDITPWFDTTNNSLYFSSDGHPGYGGYDIYHSFGDKRNWTVPQNVGGPINSSADDLHYILKEKDRKSGFLVSNREGTVPLDHETCCDDIFEFYAQIKLELIVKGDYYISDSVGGDNEVYVNLFLNTKPKPTLIARKKFNKDSSEYSFEVLPGADYKITVEKKGFFDASKEFRIAEANQKDTLKIGALKLIAQDKPIVIKNIYYPFDKDYLTDSSKTVIDTTIFNILMDNPEIIVEIGSHTDSKGSDIYNQDLSQRRAESVVNYLIEKGIAKERLLAKGYGEANPIALNEYADGEDNPDGRQKNRRTEFKVVGILQGVSDIIYEE